MVVQAEWWSNPRLISMQFSKSAQTLKKVHKGSGFEFLTWIDQSLVLLMLEKFSHLNRNVIATNVKTSVENVSDIFCQGRKTMNSQGTENYTSLFVILVWECTWEKVLRKVFFLWKGFDSTQIEWEPLEFCILSSLSCSGHFCLGYIWVASIESAVSTKTNS